MTTTITIPDLGEGVDNVDVVNVLVAVGDTVAIDQPLIEVETDKAAVEVPATQSGTITEIHVEAGQTIGPGAPILTLEAKDSNADPSPRHNHEDAKAQSGQEETVVRASRPQDAVTDPVANRRVGLAPPSSESVRETASDDSTSGSEQLQQSASAPATASASKPPSEIQNSKLKIQNSARLVPAAPTVRRFAREVGMDITEVTGSGPGGRISIDDVKLAVSQRLERGASGATMAPPVELPDFIRWGEVTREPMSKVRKLTGEAMTRAWLTAPQVTNHDLADITELEDARRAFKARVDTAGGKLTTTAILVKMVASALKRFPTLNASVDSATEEIILKGYVNIGVAVDTERGLLVPVIKNADQKNITEIAVELTDLATRARSRKLKPDEMQGGTFSISNLGGIGGTGFSPIVNWPEVAILGVSRGRVQPEWNDEIEDFEPRLMMPLSLSYDHRLVDGADAARFLRWLAEALETPLLLALEG